MTRNFDISGPASVLALAACKMGTEDVTFGFGAVGHNVTFAAPDLPTPADIPGVYPRVSVQRIFSAPGTYRYHCTIHPSSRGPLTVQ